MTRRWGTPGHSGIALLFALLVALALTGGLGAAQSGGVYVTGETDADCDGKFPQFALSIDVGVPKGDALSESDPYVVIEYETGSGEYSKLTEFEDVDTRWVDRQLSFEESDFSVLFGDFDQRTKLRVTLYDADLGADDELLTLYTEPFGVEPSDQDASKLDADLAYAPQPPQPGDDVEFTAATDGSCDVEVYQWDFDGDGEPERKGRTVTHAFREDGIRDVTLTVVNSRGVEATISREVLVLLDPDGDGITSAREEQMGTDPEAADTDGDLFGDGHDPMPTTPLAPTGLLQATVAAALYLILFVFRDRLG